MKNLLASALASALVLSASTAYAGGPVVIVDEPEVVAEKPASSVGILPLLLVGVVLCVALMTQLEGRALVIGLGAGAFVFAVDFAVRTYRARRG